AKVADYLRAAGAPGVQAVKEALVGDLRDKGIIDADGMVGKGFGRWLAKHARAIEQVPGLAEKFRDMGAAQHAVDEIALAHAKRVQEFQTGVAKGLLNEEPDVAVRQALNGQSSAKSLNRLVDLTRGNKDATDSLKQHVVRYMLDRFAPVGKEGATLENAANPELEGHSTLDAAGYRKWLDANKAPLRRLYGGQGILNFERVASALRRSKYPPAAVPGSQTAPNQLNAIKHGVGAHGSHGSGNIFNALIGEHVAEHLGASGLFGVVGAAIGQRILGNLRAAGI